MEVTVVINNPFSAPPFHTCPWELDISTPSASRTLWVFPPSVVSANDDSHKIPLSGGNHKCQILTMENEEGKIQLFSFMIFCSVLLDIVCIAVDFESLVWNHLAFSTTTIYFFIYLWIYISSRNSNNNNQIAKYNVRKWGKNILRRNFYPSKYVLLFLYFERGLFWKRKTAKI